MKTKKLKQSVLILVVATLTLLTGCNTEENQKTETKKYFSNNTELICTYNGNIYSSGILIKKSAGWSIYKNRYFKRGEELMPILNCFKGERKNVWIF